MMDVCKEPCVYVYVTVCVTVCVSARIYIVQCDWLNVRVSRVRITVLDTTEQSEDSI